MRKIKLSNYELDVRYEEDGEIKTKSLPFQVRENFADLLQGGHLKLNGHRLQKNAKIADRIIECKEDYILLEEEDFKLLNEAVMQFTGHNKSTRELVNRITEAEVIEVEEKK